MPIFGASPGIDQRLPIQQIKTMRAQGMDNNQIIQALQRDGFSSTDIFDAMNQADLMPADSISSDMPPPPTNDSDSDSNAPLYQNISAIEQDTSSDMPSSGVPPPSRGMMPPPSSASYTGSDSSTEELVEAIIDEKWNELLRDINKIIEWKNLMNTKISTIEQRFDDLKGEFDKLHTALLSKIEDYDKNITNVGAEVKAMEKVFSKVLPIFTENVSALSKITSNVKKSSKK